METFSADDYGHAARALREKSEREGGSEAMLELASRFENAAAERSPAPVAESATRLGGHRLGRLVLWLTVGALVLSALFAIGGLLGGDFGEGEARILLAVLSIWAFALSFLAGVRAAASVERAARLSGLATQVLAAASLVFSLALIAVWDGLDEAVVRGFWTVVIVTGSSTHTSFLLGWKRDDPPVRLVVVASLGVLAVLTALLLALSIGVIDDVGHGYARAIGVFAVLLTLGDLLLPVLGRLRPTRA
jgi:hypothetical protein